MRISLAGLALILTLSGCAKSPDYYMRLSEEQLCVDYHYFTSININQSARGQAISRRGLDCSKYESVARAKREAEAKRSAAALAAERERQAADFQRRSQIILDSTQDMIRKSQENADRVMRDTINNLSPPTGSSSLGTLCFLKGERTSGLNKICFYDCAGSGAAHTVRSFDLCPLNITR